MRKIVPEILESAGVTSGMYKSNPSYGFNGMFVFKDRGLAVMASNGLGWDHVSVSRHNRCPTWEEMCFIKGMFFEPSENVIQYHPPEDNYVNKYVYALHMWRPQLFDIPIPPICMV